MDQLKKVTTSIEEDCRDIAGVSEEALARMAGITERIGIPTVGTTPSTPLAEQAKPEAKPEAKPKKDDSEEVKEQEDDDEDDEDEDEDEKAAEEALSAADRWREVLGEDFDAIVVEAKKAAGKDKGKKKMDAFVAELAKRKDVRDPEALAGWLANYNPPNREDLDHPVNGPIVTEEMLRRFAALPFEVMEEEDFDRVIAELSAKKLSEDAPAELRSLAEEVARALLEARRKKRIRKALMKGGVKKIQKCTDPDKHWDPEAKACVPRTGSFKAERRVKTRKAGRGLQATHTKQRERKLKAKGIVSDTFAGRLSDLVSESKAAPKAEYTIREEVLDRIERIFGLIDEEFFDDGVSEVLLGVMEDLDEKAEAGLLSEDTMSEDEFIAALAPALKLIRECFDKIHEQDDEDEPDDDEDEDDGDDEGEDSPKDEDLLGNLHAL